MHMYFAQAFTVKKGGRFGGKKQLQSNIEKCRNEERQLKWKDREPADKFLPAGIFVRCVYSKICLTKPFQAVFKPF